MSDAHEESLLSESLSFEDVQDVNVTQASTYELIQPQKYGIVNTSKDEHASGDDGEKMDKEILLFSDTFSNVSNNSETKPREQASNAISSSFSNFSTSDSHFHYSSSSSGLEETKDQVYNVLSCCYCFYKCLSEHFSGNVCSLPLVPDSCKLDI